MEERIEKVLKTKIGTKYIFEENKGFNVFKLLGYGRNIIVAYDLKTDLGVFTKIINNNIKYFVIDIVQTYKDYDYMLEASIKMMIEVIKRSEKK